MGKGKNRSGLSSCARIDDIQAIEWQLMENAQRADFHLYEPISILTKRRRDSSA
jgi:hypothetical protein